MRTLREHLFESTEFLLGVELVSIRGSMEEKSAVKARTFAGQLVESPDIHWISITDNAGGHPQLAPEALAKPILYAGKEVVIHVTCKDSNRNGLESEAWLLHSEGFHNILAMTGDYPVTGANGSAKPVFDIDSVGLISMLDTMNRGRMPSDRLSHGSHAPLEKTDFLIGAVTTNYKLLEGEVMPQYFKLGKKVECGARFIINQVGYDARKAHELRRYMDEHDMEPVPLIGNVYVLGPHVAQIFHDNKIPGIVVSDELLDLCRRHSRSSDGGKEFFLEFAAKQMAIFRGLGYRGIYLGGVHSVDAIQRLLEIEKTFSPDDWKQFAKEIRFSRPGEYFYYDEDPATGYSVSAPNTLPVRRPFRASLMYSLSKFLHSIIFTPGRALYPLIAPVFKHSRHAAQGPALVRTMERLGKSMLYRCQDCGDCSLAEIAFLCPESQCAKNQRNGPCGGTREGRCEVDGFGECIWLQAYERRRRDGSEHSLLRHVPVVQHQGLRGTSSWANYFLGKDHTSKKS